MVQITISQISGASFPIQVYISNVFDEYLTLIGTITSGPVPPAVYFNNGNSTIPSIFNNIPQIKVKLVDANNCVSYSVQECVIQTPTPTPTVTITPTVTVTSTSTPTPTPTVLLESFKMYGVGLSALNFGTYSAANPTLVQWGDSNSDTYSSGTLLNTVKHTYASPFNGEITFNTLELSGVTSLILTNTITATTVSGVTNTTSELSKLTNLSTLSLGSLGATYGKAYLSGFTQELPRTLTSFATAYNNLSGNTFDLPSGLTFTQILGENVISGSTSGLPDPAGLTYIAITGNNVISGNTSGLPSSIDCPLFRTLSIDGNNTITGQVSSIATGLTYVLFGGYNTISGNTLDFPRNIGVGRPEGSLIMGGNCYIYGTLSDLPTETDRLSIRGLSSITGDTADLPRLLQFCFIGTVSGSCVFTGNITDIPSGCTQFDFTGSNSLSGSTSDIMSGTTIFRLSGGTSVITGDVSNIPTGMTEFAVYESNIISGNTSSLSARTPLTIFVLAGNNTVDGSLSDLPSSLNTISIAGFNTVTGYTAGNVWNSTMEYVSVVSLDVGVGFTSTAINNILIDLDNSVSNWQGDKFIQLRGTRTIASDSAYNSLISQGVTINLL